MNASKCPCGEKAITTVVHIPVCIKCDAAYAEEAKQAMKEKRLNDVERRPFFKGLVDRARQLDMDCASKYSFYNY